MRTRFAYLIALMAACAADTSSPSADITKEEAANASAGAADSPVDYCARYEWYGDGECDDFCELPDPDCGGDAARCFDAGPADRAGCCELAGYDYCAEPTTPAGCGEVLSFRANGDQLVAVVTDQAAIEHFLDKSAETFEETVEYSGVRQTITLERSFPWQVSITGEPGARVLELEELRDVDTEHPWQVRRLSTSGPPGSGLTFVSSARLGTLEATLTIRGAQMPTSRSVVYYEVGTWTFDCGANTEPPTEPSDELECSSPWRQINPNDTEKLAEYIAGAVNYTADDVVPEADARQIFAAVRHLGFVTEDAAFEAVFDIADDGFFGVADLEIGEFTFDWVEFSVGDTEVGVIFEDGTTRIVAQVSDGDVLACE